MSIPFAYTSSLNTHFTRYNYTIIHAVYITINYFTKFVVGLKLQVSTPSLANLCYVLAGIVKTPLGSCASNGYLMSGSVESVPDRQLRWSSVNNCARKASLARLNATSAGGYCGSFTAGLFVRSFVCLLVCWD